MQIRFASARPSTATVLVLPVKAGPEAAERVATLLSVPRTLVDRAMSKSTPNQSSTRPTIQKTSGGLLK